MYVFYSGCFKCIKIGQPCPLILTNTILIKKIIVFCSIILYYDYGYLKVLAMKNTYLLKSPSNPTINHMDLGLVGALTVTF